MVSGVLGKGNIPDFQILFFVLNLPLKQSIMKSRNIIALVLIIVSLCCLYPGLVEPILSIKVGASFPIVGTITLHDSTQSILGTIETLFNANNKLVAFLILMFSVMIPIFKALSLLAILLFKQLGFRKRLHRFINLISKWSMADVFVVGVFLAFLATGSDENIVAKLHNGFYFFLGYCLISIVAAQLVVEE